MEDVKVGAESERLNVNVVLSGASGKGAETGAGPESAG